MQVNLELFQIGKFSALKPALVQGFNRW